MNVRKSVVLTRQEVIDQLIPVFEEAVKKWAKGFVSGNPSAKLMMNALYNIDGKSNDELIVKWCEVCSDKFFADNKDIDDVLMLTKKDVDNNEIFVDTDLCKSWMCSRDDGEEKIT